MSHVHVHDNSGIIATIWVDENGHVKDDGSIAAHNAIEGMNHDGLGRHHGQALLDSIVKKLDRATLVGAHHCHERHT